MIHTGHFPFLLGMVGEAHVLAMYCVKSVFSNNSIDDLGDDLKHMCQTDPVLSKFQMGRTNLQYVINHGLFPHLNRWFWMKSWSHHLCQSYTTSLWTKGYKKVKWTFMYDIGMRVKTRSLWGTGHLCFFVILDVMTSLKEQTFITHWHWVMQPALDSWSLWNRLWEVIMGSSQNPKRSF